MYLSLPLATSIMLAIASHKLNRRKTAQALTLSDRGIKKYHPAELSAQLLGQDILISNRKERVNWDNHAWKRNGAPEMEASHG